MLSRSVLGPDFQRLFESGPALSIVLCPEHNYEIVAVTDSFLLATMKIREEIIGRSLFDVFPGNPADPIATGVRGNVHASLQRVVDTGLADVMPVQRYDIRAKHLADGSLQQSYW